MASLGNTLFAAGALGALVLLYIIGVRLARRSRARALAAKGGTPAPDTAAAPGTAPAPGDPALVRLERRMEDIEEAQATLAARVAEGGGEARLKEMAGSLAGLIRDRSATLETALAGLDALRDRLKTLEAIGDLAEARGLFDGLSGRIAALETARAAAASAGNPFAEIAEQLTRLYAQKDATVETVFARLAPVEARLEAIEAGAAARDPAAALAPVEARLTAEIAALRDRLKAVEAGEVPALAGLAGRLDGLQDQEAERAARLAPLAARLAALEAGAADLAAARAEITGLAARIEDGRTAFAAEIAALRAAAAENPFGEIAEQLTRLYAQKDATVETVFARLAPLEAKLSEMDARLSGLDPAAALDRFAERLEAAQAALDGRVAALEGAETPFAEIGAQLTRLYAQKDATVETVFARLAPLEAKLAEVEGRLTGLDPAAALARFAERLEAAQVAHAASEAALRDRIAALEAPGENPFAEISDQLTRLYAQKDATVETVFARLAPLEAKLSEVEGGLAGLDPQAALDRFAERLEALQARVAAVEEPGENPFGEISDQLTRLYAQKDATVETVFARLAPLEAKLTAVEGGLAGSASRLAALEAEQAARDPAAALADLAARVAALQADRDGTAARIDALQAALAETAAGAPFGEIADQLTRLYAQKDAAVAAVVARIAPLEAQLTALGDRPWEAATEEARAEAEAVAAQLIALRAAAAQTELFADRLAMLEANLPRLSAAQLHMMALIERQATGPVPAAAAADAATDISGGLDALRDLPRVVSMHHK